MIDEKPDDERIYPCDNCGKLRSKNEGGTTFTVCEECWDKQHNEPKPVNLEEFFGLHHAELDVIMMSVLKRVFSIKDAECQAKLEKALLMQEGYTEQACQARVRKIFEEIEDYLKTETLIRKHAGEPSDAITVLRIITNKVQALRKGVK